MVSFSTTKRANTAFSRLSAQPNTLSSRFVVQPRMLIKDGNTIQREKFVFIDGLYGPVSTPPYAGAFIFEGWVTYEDQPNFLGIFIEAARFRPALMTLCLTQKRIGTVRTSIPSTKDHRDIDILLDAVVVEVGPIQWYHGKEYEPQYVDVTFSCRSSHYYTERA